MIQIKAIATLCILTAVSAQNSIVKQEKPIVVNQGDVGHLNCTVSVVSKSYNVFWYQGEKKHLTTNRIVVQEFEQNKYKVKEQILSEYKRSYILTINKIQPSERGMYRCILAISGTSDQELIQMYVEIIVRVPPSIQLSQTTKTAEKLIGQDLTLKCNASGYPQPNITWSRLNGKAIPGSPNIYTFRGTTLKIKNIQKDDRGLYRCHADNTVPEPAKYDVLVQVHFPAYGRYVQDTYGMYPCVKCKLVLECIVGGEPVPELVWWKISGNTEKYNVGQTPGIDKGDTLLQEGQDYHIAEWRGDSAIFKHIDISEIYGKLIIKDFQEDDFGLYVCQGVNKYNNTFIPITVWKSDPPATFGGGIGASSVLVGQPLFLLTMVTIIIPVLTKLQPL